MAISFQTGAVKRADTRVRSGSGRATSRAAASSGILLLVAAFSICWRAPGSRPPGRQQIDEETGQRFPPAATMPASQGAGVAAPSERLVLIGEQCRGQVGPGQHRGRVDPGRATVPARNARWGEQALAHPAAGFGQGGACTVGLTISSARMVPTANSTGLLTRRRRTPGSKNRFERRIIATRHPDLITRFAKSPAQGRDQRIGTASPSR